MIKKILVCNRGEIALRVIRASNELGIPAVAIYSDVDRYALHVKRANYAKCLSQDPMDAYLNQRKIIDYALASGCDAIHPGYGFLSENAEFALKCEEAGLIFIGPKASVVALMGSKVEAREAMKQAGIPIIPGSDGEVTSLQAAKKLADKIGYPILLKAIFGGGGRGIRTCENANDLSRQFERVQSEAKKSFGKANIYLEKLVESPRHIEVQILADKHGQVVHLYERDCSVQRRHQKLVEIAPAPHLKSEARSQLYDFALQAAKAVGYTNAGTVEFLVDREENIFFLEMNTRLQVEHPITEEITGIDIVQEQIRIAEGKKLSLTQNDIKRRGYAFEFRINAEDPQNNFLPSFGRITRYYVPGGPGVRIDSAIYTGYEIPSDYDSLCAKLIVWGLDWETCLKRAKRALKETKIFGIKTTLPFYLEMLNSKAFQAGHIDTRLIETHPQWLAYSNKSNPQHKAAVIAAAIAAYSSYTE